MNLRDFIVSTPEPDEGSLVYEYDPDPAREMREASEKWKQALHPGAVIYNSDGTPFAVIDGRTEADDGWAFTILPKPEANR